MGQIWGNKIKFFKIFILIKHLKNCMVVNLFFIIVAAITIIGFFANYFFKKTKIPDIIWLMLFGYLLGPILNIVNPTILHSLIPYFSAIALLVILFDAGSRIDIYKLIEESGYTLFLTLLSYILSFTLVYLILFYILRFDLVLSIIIASVTGGTSSAIVIPLVDSLKGSLRKETSLILKLESILTDPLVIIVTLVILEVFSFNKGFHGKQIIEGILSMLSISVFLGFVTGIIWSIIWHKFEKYEYNYVFTLAFLLIMYVISDYFGGSGAIAVFTIGLMLGNIRKIRQMFRIKHSVTGLSEEIKDFNSYLVFFIRSFFFSLIGMVLSLENIYFIIVGFVISLTIYTTRYLSVLIFSKFENLSKKERILFSFMIPRGLAAAVLVSLISSQYNFDYSSILNQIVMSVIFFTVIISTIGIILFEKK